MRPGVGQREKHVSQNGHIGPSLCQAGQQAVVVGVVEAGKRRHISERSRRLALIKDAGAASENKRILVNPRQQVVRGTPGITDLSHESVGQLALEAEVVLIDVGSLQVNIHKVVARSQRKESRIRKVDVRRRRYL
jgi:hypothetical protein